MQWFSIFFGKIKVSKTLVPKLVKYVIIALKPFHKERCPPLTWPLFLFGNHY